MLQNEDETRGDTNGQETSKPAAKQALTESGRAVSPLSEEQGKRTGDDSSGAADVPRSDKPDDKPTQADRDLLCVVEVMCCLAPG